MWKKDRKPTFGPFTTMTPDGRLLVDLRKLIQSAGFKRNMEILEGKMRSGERHLDFMENSDNSGPA